MNQNEKKAELHEALSFLVESANINDGKLKKEDIDAAIKDIVIDKSQYELVYSFLASKNIDVDGFKGDGKEFLDVPVSIDLSESDDSADDIKKAENSNPETKKLEKMNLDSINQSDILDENEELKLLKLLLDDHNDKTASDSLTVSNLHLVPEICDEFSNSSVPYGDLIQEGSLGVLEGILTYDGELSLECFHDHIREAIRNALNDAVLEQNAQSRLGSHVTDLANQLDRASVVLSKDLGRSPTVEELAKYQSISEDEVYSVMKMSLNALNADNAE